VKIEKIIKACMYTILQDYLIITVPHSQSGAVPMSSLLGVGQLGFWEFGRGGSIG
jgi:hypothetical protein